LFAKINLERICNEAKLAFVCLSFQISQYSRQRGVCIDKDH